MAIQPNPRDKLIATLLIYRSRFQIKHAFTYIFVNIKEVAASVGMEKMKKNAPLHNRN